MPNLRSWIAGCCLALIGDWHFVASGQEAPARPPVFTAAQASSGAAAYRQQCAACHGAQLEGAHLAPSLTGDRFDRAWRGQTADKLLFHLQRMPPNPSGAGGGLSGETYAAILAYLLQHNGVAAGEVALVATREALASSTIPRLARSEADIDAPIAASPARTAALNRLTPVTTELLRQPPAADWLQWGRSYDGHNFSPLSSINRGNVARLKPAWRAPLRGGTSMPTPVVHDGVVFLQTIPDTVLALDGATGAVLWRHQHTPTVAANKKMGLSLHDDLVLVPTSDLHVLALKAKSGEVVWNHEIETPQAGTARNRLQLRSPPLIVGDKAIIGVTASFVPRGGFILALDLKSGKEVWRFHTIARPGEPNGESWNGLPLDRRSGGSVWHQGTYDRELNLVYFGVAPTYDTGPLLHRAADPQVTNDALYTNCTIALNPDTGKLVWAYQHAANDQWDLDWVFERQIVDLTIDGRRRKVVMNVGKMAILDALDAATGQYLFSVDAKTQNVITRIDPKTGTKTVDPEKLPDPSRPAVVCPAVSGARAWPPTSYDAQTALLYLPLTEWCNRLSPEGFKLMTSGVGISPAEHPDSSDGTMGRLQAVDVKNQRLAWVHHQPAPLSTSVLGTGGGVVFAGDLDPSLKAFDAATGALLWRAALDDLPSSSVVTYAIDGRQYVAVVVGLRNNHVSDMARTYTAFRKRHGIAAPAAPDGGAAVWVFALQP